MKFVIAMLLAFAAAGIVLHLTAVANEENSFSLDDIAWIAGTWAGLGPNDYSGEELVYSVWTGPVGGTMSWTFRYYTPGNKHVHYAYTMLEETDGGVLSRGIHYGRDFKNFEKAAWVFQMTAATDTEVTFECIENCRVKSVSFELTSEGLLLEKYRTLDDSELLPTFRYERVPAESAIR